MNESRQRACSARGRRYLAFTTIARTRAITANVAASTSIADAGPPAATRMPPVGAPRRRITRPSTWFQPITVPKSSGLTIWRISDIPDGRVRPAATPNEKAMTNSVAAPSYPACHASAPSNSTSARATWPAISTLRGSQRSATTPPRRTSTACGSISAPMTAPARAGSRVCAAVQARATIQTESPNADTATPTTQVRTIRSPRTGGGGAPISVGPLGVSVALMAAPACWGTPQDRAARREPVGVGVHRSSAMHSLRPLREHGVQAPVQVSIWAAVALTRLSVAPAARRQYAGASAISLSHCWMARTW